MPEPTLEGLSAAEMVLSARPFEETLAFFTHSLGFRVAAIHPADSPSCAVIVGHGLRLRLDATRDEEPGTLRILREGHHPAEHLVAPNGTRIEIVPANPSLHLPELEPSFTLSRADDQSWKVGRAGMRYRDLLPHRQGGRYGASHIWIEDGGEVMDYVHYHRVCFQLIYCYRGWVRLAYEGQGPDFVMRAGDCILQPPEIRHRVLESSAGLEVIEVSSPAEHETHGDLELTLPGERAEANRPSSGQRFLHHVAEGAEWTSVGDAGFVARDLELEEAAGGALEAHVLRCAGRANLVERDDRELNFHVILDGSVEAEIEGAGLMSLGAGDAFHAPAGTGISLHAEPNTELLRIKAPGRSDRGTR